jgi:hypothetical protein
MEAYLKVILLISVITVIGALLNALRYGGTEQDGSDVYDAEFANGRARFRLLFQEDGKIAGASFE